MMPDALPERGTDEWRAWAKDQVIEGMSAKGWSLRRCCREPHMPDPATVLRWKASDEAFAQRYAPAREALYEHWAEETLEIADDTSNDTKLVGEAETEVANTEWISRSRLRVDTRKWLLSKLLPKTYGDKIQHAGEDGGPLTIAVRRFTGA